jgi:transcriptional regulator of acetoin/glycerol metabolism
MTRQKIPMGTAGHGFSSGDKEHDKLLATLQKYKGHRKKTARALGIDRTTLWRKMKKYGLYD